MAPIRKSYHSTIKMAFALGIQKEWLPETFRKSISRSTSHYWKDKSPESFVGYEYASEIKDNIEDVKLIYDDFLRRERQLFIAYSKLKQTLFNIVGEEAIKEALKAKSHQLVKTVEQVKNTLGGVSKICKQIGLKPRTYTYWKAIQKHRCDLSPFGMLQPNRHGGEYSYGYQGSEMDNEVKGKGNSYTTHFRQLDPRLGRWLSIDPKASKFPWQSPYVSMDNNPVLLNDPMGDETDDWYTFTDDNGQDHIFWDNETGEAGSKITRTIDGEERELTNIGKSITIKTISEIRTPNDIAIPNTVGVKLTTFYTMTGNYGSSGNFTGITTDFNRETGQTFGMEIMEGTEGVEGKTNSVTKLTALQFKDVSVWPLLGRFEQHTQVPHVEGFGLKLYTDGKVVDVNQEVNIQLVPSYNGAHNMHRLSLDVSHGTFPSVKMTLNNKNINSLTIYNYQQSSFALTHGNPGSLAVAHSSNTGAGKEVFEFGNKLNAIFKKQNSPWVRFSGFNAGTDLFNPK